jgi:MFS family permease
VESPTARSSPAGKPHYWRNFAALVGDYVGFSMGMAFVSATTVLPAFMGRLTENKALVGLVSTVADGAWLLPQVIFANLLVNKRHKKRYVTAAGLIGRPLFLLYGLGLGLGLARDPTLALALLMVAVFFFTGSDSFASVAWFDVLAKTIPEERRGRLVGISQVIYGLLAIGQGALITVMLEQEIPPYPLNYALFFGLSGALLLLSLLSWQLLVEPDEAVERERASWRDYVPQLLRLLRQDRVLARLIVVRLLSGFDLMAFNFYVLFATEYLQLPEYTVGIFLAVQTIGGILASAGLGLLSERAGSHRVVQVATAVSVTAPLVALGLALGTPAPLAGLGQGGAEAGLATLVTCAWTFLAMGVVGSSFMLGFMNYVLELAPAGQRPTYTGLFNTIGGALVLLPLLGGWLVDLTNWWVLFAFTASMLAVAHVLSWRLPSARRSAGAPAGTEG